MEDSRGFHRHSGYVVKMDGDGNPLTAGQLGLTLRQTLEEMRGGATHQRAGVTKNNGRKRNKARTRMAKTSRARNRR